MSKLIKLEKTLDDIIIFFVWLSPLSVFLCLCVPSLILVVWIIAGVLGILVTLYPIVCYLVAKAERKQPTPEETVFPHQQKQHSQAEEIVELLKECREDGHGREIPIPPDPIILAEGVVKVTFNDTIENILNDGTAYNEQTLGFSVSKPLDYMAIMGTKRQSPELIKELKRYKETMYYLTS